MFELGEEVAIMPREKNDAEFTNVTVRIEKELYSDYKIVLKELGKIPTYDIRNHMKDVIANYEEEKK